MISQHQPFDQKKEYCYYKFLMMNLASLFQLKIFRIIIFDNQLSMKDRSAFDKIVIMTIPFFGCLASMVSGYFLVYFTMLEASFQAYHNYSMEENDKYFTIMMTALPVGAFLGTFFYNRFVNGFGENQAMKILDMVAVLAVVLQLITLYYPVVFVSRLIMGFHCAITAGLIPSWILSMSPQKYTGLFGTFSYLAFVFGMAQAYCMGELLETQNPGSGIERIVFLAVPILPSLIHLLGVEYLGFDNIERLIQEKNVNQVVKYMKRMYGNEWKMYDQEIRNFKMIPIEKSADQSNIEQRLSKFLSEQKLKDIDQIEQNPEQKSSKVKKSTYEATKSKFMKYCCGEDANSTILAVILAMANQTSGIFVILEYSKQLFTKIEFAPEEAHKAIISLAFFRLAAALFSGFFINKFGRRSIMLIGQAIVAVSLLCCTFLTIFMTKHEILTTVFVVIYIFGYSISLGPIFMMYAIEALLNVQLILKIYWGLMILLTLSTDILIERTSISFMFGIFFVCSFISFIFFYHKIVETKDIPKKEIKQRIRNSKIQWESSNFLEYKTETKDYIENSLADV